MAVASVAALMTISGCISCNSLDQHEAGDDGAKGTGQYVSGSALFNADNVTWFAYKSTTAKSDDGSTYVQTVGFNNTNVTYEGVDARHVTATIDGPEASGYIEYYYDVAAKKALKAHMAMNASGIMIELDIPVGMIGDKFREFSFENPLATEEDETRFELMGSESVTVPAGTFTGANKYRNTEESGSYIWAVSGVPVPLKIVSNDDRRTTTIELLGWG